MAFGYHVAYEKWYSRRFYVPAYNQFAHSLSCSQKKSDSHNFFWLKWATVSESLRSLTKNERVSKLLFFLSKSLICSLFWQKTSRVGNSLIVFLSESIVFCQNISEWAICSKKWAICSFAHFWWATWSICSWSLISSEQSEQIAHGRSFLVSDLSD